MDTKANDQQPSSEADAPLFRFAILADTHMNPRDGETSSPWLTNKKANDRARAVVRQINRLMPNFTIHLGDIVHPIPAQETYVEAAERALGTFTELKMPIHYVAGNHDMGDKPLDWMPAQVVNEDFISIYMSHFGADYYTFDHGDVRFVILNAQILNSGMEREVAQWQWLKATLSNSEGKRLFVFSHYPLYIAEPDEREHYDNLGEPARAQLLALFEQHKVEAFFSGHVHNFFYDRRCGMDMYVLPAVSAVRHDYMDMFQIAPGNTEHGRDDNAKLGFFLVDVHSNGHIAHFVRSYGAAEEDSGVDSNSHTHHLFRIPRVHSRLQAPCPVGVDLRQTWAEAVPITPSGAVDEFYRKKARNDYILAALWEMGLRKLRVPVDDLLNGEARDRIRILHELGHDILLFSYEVPVGSVQSALIEHAELFSGLELIVPSHRIPAAISEIALLKQRTELPIYLSRLRSSAEAKAAGARYTHFISHGFTNMETEDVREILSIPEARSILDGFVFRVSPDEFVWQQIPKIAELAGDLRMKAVAQLTLADENPALLAGDELTTTARVAATLFTTHCYASICSVYLDTLADVDRGYFPRLGLVDRLFNPRLAGKVFATMQAELGQVETPDKVSDLAIDGGHVLCAHSSGKSLHLILTKNELPLDDIPLPNNTAAMSQARIIDLESGRETVGIWTADGTECRVKGSTKMKAGKPLLIVTEHEFINA